MMIIVKEVLKEHHADRPGTAFYDEELSNLYRSYTISQSCFYVIEKISNKKIVGGAGIGPLAGGNKTICELKKMHILPEARGIGLGKLLLQKVLNSAHEFGYLKCYLETLSHFYQAKQLYTKMGFIHLDKPMGNTGHHSCDEWMIKKL